MSEEVMYRNAVSGVLCCTPEAAGDIDAIKIGERYYEIAPQRAGSPVGAYTPPPFPGTPGQMSRAFGWLRQQALDGSHSAMLLLQAMTEGSAIGDVICERTRQIHSEGWTYEHDDNHDAGEIAAAAAAYALNASCVLYPLNMGVGLEKAPEFWLWHESWWKPKDPRRDLVRAGALIVAEIERLDRQSTKKGTENHE